MLAQRNSNYNQPMLSYPVSAGNAKANYQSPADFKNTVLGVNSAISTSENANSNNNNNNNNNNSYSTYNSKPQLNSDIYRRQVGSQ